MSVHVRTDGHPYRPTSRRRTFPPGPPRLTRLFAPAPPPDGPYPPPPRTPRPPRRSPRRFAPRPPPHPHHAHSPRAARSPKCPLASPPSPLKIPRALRHSPHPTAPPAHLRERFWDPVATREHELEASRGHAPYPYLPALGAAEAEEHPKSTPAAGGDKGFPRPEGPGAPYRHFGREQHAEPVAGVGDQRRARFGTSAISLRAPLGGSGGRSRCARVGY